MPLPLYKGARLPQDISQANRALLFEKFYLWGRRGGALKDQDKIGNIKRLSGLCGERDRLYRTTLDHYEMVDTLNGSSQVFTNEWHAVIGMGIDHPLENGMAWHHTLGTPYLAGSAVKGLVRAYCEVWEEWETKKIERCFGKAAVKEEDGSAGAYIFFDALPTRPVTLTADVMTPHMGQWYEDGGKEEHDHENTPGDWHTPIPIPFLAIKDISLLFSIAPRHSMEDKKELEELMQALKDALEWIGTGAKTAAGYGRFHDDVIKTQALIDESKENERKSKHALETSNMSPIEQIIEEHRLKDPNVPKETLLIKLIEGDAFKELHCDAIDLLRKTMERSGNWKTSSTKKNPNKDKQYKNTLKALGWLDECKKE